MASLNKQIALLKRDPTVFFEGAGPDGMLNDTAFHRVAMEHVEKAQASSQRRDALCDLGEMFEQILLAYADDCIAANPACAAEVSDVED